MKQTIPFEVLGHFEEIIDQESGKCYATYPITYDRPPAYGYAGRREHLFRKGDVVMKDFHHKGLGTYTFKAPAKCWIMTHPICGRLV